MTEHKRTCVIGGGPAGIVSIKYVKEFSEVVCYEARSVCGGLWDISEDSGEEFNKDMGFPMQSIYEGLTGIVPVHHMHYKDLKPKENEGRSYFTREEFLQYLKDYMEKFDVEKHIKYGHYVSSVKKREGKWEVCANGVTE